MRPRSKYSVYGRDVRGLDHFLGATVAVSERQACNQIRRRVYGDKSYAQIPLAFWAEPAPAPSRRPVGRQQTLF